MLRLHSYAHSYLPTLSLHVQLCAVYTRQVQTIGGAILHHLATAHQRYINWATMVVYSMRAHNQWLHMACQGVEQVYFASFQKVSRGLWGVYEAKLREFCYHHYDRARREKFTLFSHAASHSTQQHLAAEATRWTETGDHWLTNAPGSERAPFGCGGQLCPPPPSQGETRPFPRRYDCERACSHDRRDSCVVQLTGSPLRQAHHTDAIQLMGSHVRWNAAFTDDGSFSPCTLAQGVFFGASHICPLFSLLHNTLPSQSLTGGLLGAVADHTSA